MASAATLIEFAGALILCGYLLVAIYRLTWTRSLPSAQAQVANGAIAALNLKMAATLLKLLLLASWQQIGMFTVIFILRLILKKSFLRSLHDAPAAHGGFQHT